MVHRTITGMSGLPRTLRTCHLPAEMFAASRSLWTGSFPDTEEVTGAVGRLTMAVMICYTSCQAAPCGRPQAAVLGRRKPDGGSPHPTPLALRRTAAPPPVACRLAPWLPHFEPSLRYEAVPWFP